MAGRHSNRFVGMDMRDPPIDFAAVARGFGLAARCVTDPDDIGRVMRAAIDSGVPNLVEFIVDDGFGNGNA